MDPEILVGMHLEFPNTSDRLITQLWIVVEWELEFAISTGSKLCQTAKWTVNEFVRAFKYGHIELEVVCQCMAWIDAQTNFSFLALGNQRDWESVLGLIFFAEAECGGIPVRIDHRDLKQQKYIHESNCLKKI